MTDPTPQTQPEPPAAEGLSDEELLQIAANAIGYDDDCDLFTVSAADRARRPDPVAPGQTTLFSDTP